MIIGTHIHSNKFGTNRTQNHQSLLKYMYIVKRSMRARVRYQRHISLNVIIIIANI